MAELIKDGGGTGVLAKVTADGKLRTEAKNVPQRLVATVEKSYWEMTTGVQTLTDAAETPMVYIKNTDSEKVFE